uniref:AlNc14C421G11527 protein n=1 Tax=Albugo laibachii Nc14 TaxID=890382 RepID=F0WZC4_9STRA|nr:AlNc14C421G11527 [Albugo laibachii Nc14]|eukprot:CCA26842.1 AlNc14C421G11527 [Albugo laibachii Nc14]
MDQRCYQTILYRIRKGPFDKKLPLIGKTSDLFFRLQNKDTQSTYRLILPDTKPIFTPFSWDFPSVGKAHIAAAVGVHCTNFLTNTETSSHIMKAVSQLVRIHSNPFTAPISPRYACRNSVGILSAVEPNDQELYT